MLARDTKPWTAGVALPGGDVAVDGIENLRQELMKQLPFLDAFTIRRLIRQYGTQAFDIFSNVTSLKELGEPFGHGVYSHEIDWALANEWVCTGQDFLWRRSKMGLRFSKKQAGQLDAYIQKKIKKLRCQSVE